jgi:hypothetical protein
MTVQSHAASEARVVTAMARRHLAQLCKHFQHKLPVTLGEAQGSITFPGGLCTLEVGAEALVMRLAAEDAAARKQLEEVIARHLLRFAFRDPPEIYWTRAS